MAIIGDFTKNGVTLKSAYCVIGDLNGSIGGGSWSFNVNVWASKEEYEQRENGGFPFASIPLALDSESIPTISDLENAAIESGIFHGFLVIS
ncbi:hypothetical protein [Klebsiella pneumoniae]|uniref:hypothetical protein n=1 Tax=Klebsiella pneumoniae TaxID=573 RepID=UPI002DBA0312|nr:hypothetical protein [Klebsiella pneumoniae]MEB6135659.1 hypothetical protein [Klebsiella pneumoniae]